MNQLFIEYLDVDLVDDSGIVKKILLLFQMVDKENRQLKQK